MKTADEWAKIFKLHSCVGNKKFAEQVRKIQADAIAESKPTSAPAKGETK